MSFIAGWSETGINNEGSENIYRKIRADAGKFSNDRLIKHDSKLNTFIASENNVFQIGRYSLVFSGSSNENKDKAKEIINLYKEKNEEFVSHLDGSFAVVLADQEQRKVILAIDRIGIKALYYAQTKKGLVFGSTADGVIAHPDVNSELSSQAIYDYVYFHHCPSPDTIYKQVKKLEGGTVLVFQSGKITISRYWMPAFQESMELPIDKAGELLRENLVQAVKKVSTNFSDTGAFLSGGLDSSSVAGALSKVFPGEANTFSMGFPVQGYDEISYARIAVDHFKTKQHEYYLTADDTVAAIPKIAEYYDEPFGNSSALAAYYCAKLAKKNGIKLLLAGDGGDEIFAGNERYSRQLLFDQYQAVPNPLRQLLKSSLKMCPKMLLKNKLFFKAKRYVDQAETPMPDRLQDYNFLHRHAVSEVFADDFAQQIDNSGPLNKLRESYQRPDHASTLNRMLYMDWKSTLHDNDLVKVNKMCEMAGVEVQYPLLDQNIINLSCKIPSNLKLKGQKLRWFYKHAMGEFLPEQIINKSKHGFGLPFGIWLKDHQPLKELAYDSINDLKKRDYFRPEFVDHAITMHQSIHAPYYGELIWILMMLELWLKAKV